MFRRICRAKIHAATVTACDVDYEGSIEIDEDLIERAGLCPFEMVLVANLVNGERFETYVITGPRGSGVIGLNGAAALLGKPGDQVIIMAIGVADEAACRGFKPVVVKVDEKNRVKQVVNAPL